MGAAAVIAGVLAQVQEFLDIHVPGFKVSTHGTFTFTPLVYSHGRIIGDFQERHHALRFTVGALDMGAQCAYRGPVVTESAGKLG